jgi:hypothetical protein
MLRKWMVSSAVAAMLVVGVVGAAMAADETPAPPYGAGQCTEFVDVNGDGVCDNAPQDGTGNQNQRGGQGNQGNRPSQAGTGQGTYGSADFVDADGDGQCDLWQDADGDGVNDAAPRDGTGNRNQRGGGRGQR